MASVQSASLSARRAWIEIGDDRHGGTAGTVALRKESVDRNSMNRPHRRGSLVALRKESVDRNTITGEVQITCTGRSPQGERG